MFGPDDHHDEIERRAVMPAACADVWAAITSPAELPRWFGADVDLRLEPGGDAVFRGHDGERRRGTVDEVDAPRLLSFRWWPLGRPLEESTVTVTLRPVNAGAETEVVVTERRARPPAGRRRPGTVHARYGLSA